MKVVTASDSGGRRWLSVGMVVVIMVMVVMAQVVVVANGCVCGGGDQLWCIITRSDIANSTELRSLFENTSNT